MTVRIRIGNDDIKIGKQGKGESCPVAHAIKKKFGQSIKVEVHRDFVFINGRYEVLPDYMSKWIGQFDLNRHVMPVDFELPEPQVELKREKPVNRVWPKAQDGLSGAA